MSQIEEIKSRLDILQVVGQYVKLTKTGINHRGICPFHAEKGPSFFVSPGRQLFKCFGCGKGGDMFAFVKEIEGVEFGDALKILAEKAGVTLKKENPQLRTERERLYQICELACSFYQKQLAAGEWGKKAREYLLGRGLTEASIAKWRLGYSPDQWQSLSDFLVGKGYSRDEILKAGLAVNSEKSNRPYDRFRGRIMFPIFDTNGKPIGFGARVFKEADKKETAKYINNPQTLLYDKSSVLYGMHAAKVPTRKYNQCVLTEGYTDAILCHQAGFENTVAVSGTALTQRHLHLLKRYTENLILAFDMDVAGDSATKRGINLAEAQGFNLKIIETYQGAKDPADIIAENPEHWKAVLEKARGIMEYYFDSAFAKFDAASAGGKKSIGGVILPAIKRLPNKIEQSHWIAKLAQRLGVKEEAVLEELRQVQSERPQQLDDSPVAVAEPERASVTNRRDLLEKKIVSLAMKDPSNLGLIQPDHEPLLSERLRQVISHIRQAGGNPETVLASMQEGPYKDMVDELAWQAEVDFQEDGPEELRLCLEQLKEVSVKEQRMAISAAIQDAQLQGDQAKVSELIQTFNRIH